MAKKNENRVLVALVCEECKSQNYNVSKNKKNTTGKISNFNFLIIHNIKKYSV